MPSSFRVDQGNRQLAARPCSSSEHWSHVILHMHSQPPRPAPRTPHARVSATGGPRSLMCWARCRRSSSATGATHLLGLATSGVRHHCPLVQRVGSCLGGICVQTILHEADLAKHRAFGLCMVWTVPCTRYLCKGLDDKSLQGMTGMHPTTCHDKSMASRCRRIEEVLDTSSCRGGDSLYCVSLHPRSLPPLARMDAIGID